MEIRALEIEACQLTVSVQHVCSTLEINGKQMSPVNKKFKWNTKAVISLQTCSFNTSLTI